MLAHRLGLRYIPVYSEKLKDGEHGPQAVTPDCTLTSYAQDSHHQDPEEFYVKQDRIGA